ncbi:Acyl-coenzyme A thioesterase PaaI, contains HGG motif [Geodermatophilus pulveris]|uniref:Acyl-coenzyme A thioesterase PaaI, contains HGG motif n=1 Tax=Geodermatophilus pulveris TaxID=1564159 RepID=A0A239AKD0_9ACTN|nr:PaaI family thioesterase [Geodermatophilus pulveris]SNR95448.1 Acyl-coenzyme A thioesterase PaaI, contains HGG motif [Geodermatophilus pulveris]
MHSDAGGQPHDADLMAAVTELGSALRELVDASVRSTVPAAELRAAAADARTVTARLAAAQRPVTQLPELDDPAVFRRVHNPVTGVGSALAPPLDIRREDGGLVAEATLGPAYEGPPGYVHGGVSSLLMDQLLGSAVLAAGLWGMTAQLELGYHRPVPLVTPLVLRARVVGSRGRRTSAAGSIALATDPERPLVDARGEWVTPRPESVTDYFAAITDVSGQYAPPGRR